MARLQMATHSKVIIKIMFDIFALNVIYQQYRVLGKSLQGQCTFSTPAQPRYDYISTPAHAQHRYDYISTPAQPIDMIILVHLHNLNERVAGLLNQYTCII